MSEITPERVEEALNVLRENVHFQGEGRPRLFRLRGEQWKTDTFDDAMQSPEFIRRALEERLPVPFKTYRGPLPLSISDNLDFVKRGMPLEIASERLRNDKAVVIDYLYTHPFYYLRMRTENFRYDEDVARAALLGAAEQDARYTIEDAASPVPEKTRVERIGNSIYFYNLNLPFAIEAAARFNVGPMAGLDPAQLIKLDNIVRDQWDKGPGKGWVVRTQSKSTSSERDAA